MGFCTIQNKPFCLLFSFYFVECYYTVWWCFDIKPLTHFPWSFSKVPTNRDHLATGLHCLLLNLRNHSCLLASSVCIKLYKGKDFFEQNTLSPASCVTSSLVAVSLLCVLYITHTVMFFRWCDTILYCRLHSVSMDHRQKKQDYRGGMSFFQTPWHCFSVVVCYFPSPIQILCSRQSSHLFSVSEDRLGEKKSRQKVQKCISLSPSSAPASFFGEYERKLEKRLARTHSSALHLLSSHILSFTHFFYFLLFGCFLDNETQI